MGFAANFTAASAAIVQPVTQATNLTLQLAGGATAPKDMTFTLSVSPAGTTVATVPQQVKIPLGGFSVNVPVTAVGPGVVAIHAIDTTDGVADTSEQVTVIAQLQITNATLPSVRVNTAYPQTQIVASGGTPAYTYSVSPTLPAGLSLDPVAGVITGTPTGPPSTGTFTFTVTDKTNPLQTATKALTLTVLPPLLTITTTSPLPPAAVGIAYNFTLQPSGGTPNYTWGAPTPPLPTGLSLSSAGVITGTPTSTQTTVTTGTYTFTVTDSSVVGGAQTATATLSLTLNPKLAITTASLPPGITLTAYSQTVAAIGGVGAYTWTLTGTLPPTLSFNTATGTISGTPTAAAANQGNPASLTFKVTDSGNPQQTATATLTLAIAPFLSVTTTSLPAGEALIPYTTTQLTSSGGTGAITWTQTGGTLPMGMSFSAAGVISGTPQFPTPSPVSLTFKATDVGPPQQTANSVQMQLSIAPFPLAFQNTTLASGAQVTLPYTSTFTAIGGYLPYTWSSTGLPSPLAINPATGVVSGTPALGTDGTYNNLTFTVTDAVGKTATINASLTILPAQVTGCASVSIGQNLQVPCVVTLFPAAAAPTQVTVTSNSPTLLAVSNAANSAGSSSAIITVPTGATQAVFFLQALVKSGTATFSTTAGGYTTSGGNGTATFQNSGIVLSGPGGFASGGTGVNADITTQPGATPTVLVVQSAMLDGNFNYVANQAIAGGFGATVVVATSNSSVANVSGSPVSINGGSGSATVPFAATGGTGAFNYGAITVNLQGLPSGFSVPAAKYTSLTANVTAQLNGTSMVLSPVSAVGKGLETAVTMLLPVLTPSAVGTSIPFTVTVDNPALLVLAGHNDEAGASPLSSREAVLGKSLGSTTFYAQGLASSGVATITASVSYNGTTYTASTKIMLTPGGVVLIGPNGLGQPFTVSAQTATALTVSAARLDAGFNYIEPELVPTAVVTNLASSNTSVGTITATGTIAAGTSTAASPGVVFTSLNPVSTTLSVAGPAGFITPSFGGTLAATVTPLTLSGLPVTVGKGLEASTTIAINGGIVDPSGQSSIALTITGNNGIQVAKKATDAGSSSIAYTGGSAIATGHTSSPPFFVYGTGSGNGSITATATLTSPSGTFTFSPVTVPVTVNPSGFVISGPNGMASDFSTTLGTGVSTITVSSALLDSQNNFIQPMPLNGNAAANVTVSMGTSGVGTLNPASVNIPAGSGSGTTVFTPAGAGTTLLTAAEPSGFNVPQSPALNQLNATVTLPGILVTDGNSIGKFLQTTANLTLGAPPTGPLGIKVTSNNYPAVALSTNGTDGGFQVIHLTVPAGQTSAPPFYVYNTNGTPGTTASYTATATGYLTFTKTDNLTASGVTIQQGPIVTTGAPPVGTPQPLTTGVLAGPLAVAVTLNQLDSSNNPVPVGSQTAGPQALAGSVTGPITVTVHSSGPTLGPDVQATFQAGSATATANFAATGLGTTTLTVSQPTGFLVPNTVNTNNLSGTLVSVASTSVQLLVLPDILATAGNISLGQYLEVQGTVGLSVTPPARTGGVQVTLTSNDPAHLLFSTNGTGTDAGTASVQFTIAAGATNPIGTYYLYGGASSGSGTFTATATLLGLAQSTANPGGWLPSDNYAQRVFTVTYVPSGLTIQPSTATTSLATGAVPVTVTLKQLNSSNVVTSTGVLAGNVTGGLPVTLVSNPNLGSGTLTIPVQGSTGTANFTPTGVGVTTVTPTATGLATPTTNATVQVTVLGDISGAVTGAISKANPSSGTLTFSPKTANAITVTLTSNDPTNLQFSLTGASGSYMSTLPISVAANATSVTYFVETLTNTGSGSYTINSSAGYIASTVNVTYAP